MAYIPKDPPDDFDVWKYYGGIGGADKDRMIQIVSWLLAFSASILGAYATNKLVVFSATAMLLVIGMLLSLLAGFISLLYGGYATWNWSIADRIAQDNVWQKQKPDFNPFAGLKTPRLSRLPLWLAKPSENNIALVFWLFFFVSLVSLVAHALVLYWSWLGRADFERLI